MSKHTCHQPRTGRARSSHSGTRARCNPRHQSPSCNCMCQKANCKHRCPSTDAQCRPDKCRHTRRQIDLANTSTRPSWSHKYQPHWRMRMPTRNFCRNILQCTHTAATPGSMSKAVCKHTYHSCTCTAARTLDRRSPPGTDIQLARPTRPARTDRARCTRPPACRSRWTMGTCTGTRYQRFQLSKHTARRRRTCRDSSTVR